MSGSPAWRRRISVHRGRSRWLLPAAVAVCYGLMQLAAYGHSAVYPDSARYVSLAQRMLGVDRPTADRRATELLCASNAERTERARRTDVRRYNHGSVYHRTYAECLAANREGMYPRSPRYQEIFSTRPGFPALMAPLVAVAGPRQGMWATSVLLAMGCGLLVAALLRMLGAGPRFAVLGQVLFHTLPVGFWSSRMLAEAPTMLATLLVLIGALLVVHGRPLPGTAIAVPAVALGAAVRYSSILLVTAAVAVAAAACWWLDRRGRTLYLAAGAALVTGIIAVGARLLGVPGTAESLQDTFTAHFDRPDVPDPWYRLAVVNHHYWPAWLLDHLSTPLILLAVPAGALALWRWHRAAALLVCAVAATGIATQVAHPDVVEGDRLYSPVWLAAVVGIPVALALLAGDPRRSAVAGRAVRQAEEEPA